MAISKGSNLLDSSSGMLYLSICIDYNFLFTIFNSTTGINILNRYTNSFTAAGWDRILSSIKQDINIFIMPGLDATQYIYVYNTVSNAFTNSYVVSSTEFYYTLIARSYIIFLIGANAYNGAGTTWNISKICLKSFYHYDLSITTNTLRTLSSTEFPIISSSPISNSSVSELISVNTTKILFLF